ncbi:MAG: hypothetical protein MJZ31_09750 [Bacteroidales bacterium]|nr:hypothetical protein [Bacteroidales bacterium]
MERAFFLIIAVSLAYGVGCMGRNRRIGFGWAFGLSLLNVFIGLIAVLLSKKIPKDEINKVERKED